MREYTISDFKAHALAILKGIDQTGESVLVTKRGRLVARVEPAGAGQDQARPGRLKGTITREDDIVAPLGADAWEAARPGEPL
jgi:antitoxin (DNA-binding transcriptional repressor) of toxin-antitoxin stability system